MSDWDVVLAFEVLAHDGLADAEGIEELRKRGKMEVGIGVSVVFFDILVECRDFYRNILKRFWWNSSVSRT